MGKRRTKAAILVKQNAPLAVTEVEIPKLEIGQVLVKVEHSGICGKQLDEISGKRGVDPFLPHLLGHEGGGIIEDVGPGVSKVKEGDHVVLHWMKGSGINSAPPKFNCNGSVVNAGWVTTFSEHTVVSENRVTPIPANVDLDVASLLGCAVTTGLGIVFNNANLKPGESVAVFGIGGVGLNVVQAAALVNAYPIVAIDLYSQKLEWALNFGATHTVNASQTDAKQFLLELSDGRGFDVTVDTTGNTDVFQTAYNATSHTGKAILAGVLHHQKPITIDGFPFHFGRQIIGSHGGDTRPDVDIPRYIRLYQFEKLKLDEQITHRYCLDEINEAIAVVQRGEAGRCVISMS
jgi:S-(hydroxymethyl)glutathione dehydrogenase/alcohol dehydrogenase